MKKIILYIWLVFLSLFSSLYAADPASVTQYPSTFTHPTSDFITAHLLTIKEIM